MSSAAKEARHPAGPNFGRAARMSWPGPIVAGPWSRSSPNSGPGSCGILGADFGEWTFYELWWIPLSQTF